tara:strand:- start:87 stop:311 length:225 start_codon:yes stop_codon:yes gene_type:complete
MDKKIIYKQENGMIAIITPSSSALELMSIDDIAQKDVPTGLNYKIINTSDLPTDLDFIDAWTIDDAELTDGVGE